MGAFFCCFLTCFLFQISGKMPPPHHYSLWSDLFRKGDVWEEGLSCNSHLCSAIGLLLFVS